MREPLCTSVEILIFLLGPYHSRDNMRRNIRAPQNVAEGALFICLRSCMRACSWPRVPWAERHGLCAWVRNLWERVSPEGSSLRTQAACIALRGRTNGWG